MIREKAIRDTCPFLTLDEVVELLGVSRQTMYQLTHKKRLPHLKVNGKLLYFLKEDVESEKAKRDASKSRVNHEDQAGACLFKLKINIPVQRVRKPCKVTILELSE